MWNECSCCSSVHVRVCPRTYEPCEDKEWWALKIIPSRNTILFGGAEQWGRFWAWVLSRRCSPVCRNVLYRARQLHTLAQGVTADSHRLLRGTAHSHIWSHTLAEAEMCSFTFHRLIWSSAVKGGVMLHCLHCLLKRVPSSSVHPPSFTGSLIVMTTASFPLPRLCRPGSASRARTHSTHCAQECGNLATGLESQITELGRWWATVPRLLRGKSCFWRALWCPCDDVI